MANLTKIRVSGVTYTIVDETAIHSLAGYSTTAEMNQAITAATDALASEIAQAGYQTASDVQNAIQGKADTTAMTQAIADAVAGKADTSDLAPLFGYVAYDSETHRINFKHASTDDNVLAYVDASPFLVDGMVESVSIVTVENAQYLRITWNTDSGKQATDIALTDIFNPANYYNKSEIDAALADKANTADTYTKTQVDNALGGKQATLVSGTNIKTVNNQSLLGEGNIEIAVAVQADQTIIEGSSNAVAGGAVYTALKGKNQVVTLDGETLVIS